MSIPVNRVIGIVGPSGSGKTTLVDILLGLIEPQQGQLKVDGIIIKDQNRRPWQNTIGFVAQSIFLSEGTIAENVAFGIPQDQIDLEQVQQALKLAHLVELLQSLEKGVHTKVGERGVQLSGGQRQRIGIARALYKKASVLVFDEATSALDNATEQEVMSSIEGLKRDLTILIIAHRITTVRRCDVIVELDRGRVVAQGTFEQLIQNSPSFRGLAKAMEVEKTDNRL